MIEILQDQNTTLPDGVVVRQQNIKLRGLNGDFINNEAIAEEIVRTLTGSIGLILAVPISTWIAVRWLKEKRES